MNMPISIMLMHASDVKNVLKPALIKLLFNYPTMINFRETSQLHNKIYKNDWANTVLDLLK
jgi:hypothetical protein